MNEKGIHINIPDVLKRFRFERLFTTPINKFIGVGAFSEKLGKSHVLRLYQLNLIRGQFEVIKEIGAYSFPDRLALRNFKDRLEEMSALELLLLSNGSE